MAVKQQFPQAPTSRLVGDDGRVTPAWQAFMSSLWNRTGGASGDASAVLDQLGNPLPGVTLFRGPSIWQYLSIGASGRLYTVSPGLFPQWESASSLIDRVFGSTPGMVLYRGASLWQALAIGASGRLFTASSTPLPQWEALSSLLDRVIGLAVGDLIVRGGGGWTALPVGIPEQVLMVAPAGTSPSWRNFGTDAVAFASLPGAPRVGEIAAINNGPAALAWGAAASGGGGTTYLVWWNGANWTVIGK